MDDLNSGRRFRVTEKVVVRMHSGGMGELPAGVAVVEQLAVGQHVIMPAAEIDLMLRRGEVERLISARRMLAL